MKAGPPNEVKSSPAIVSRYTRKKIALAAGDNVSRPFLQREQALGFDAAKENAAWKGAGRQPCASRGCNVIPPIYIQPGLLSWSVDQPITINNRNDGGAEG
jgi:hypothetical protein